MIDTAALAKDAKDVVEHAKEAISNADLSEIVGHLPGRRKKRTSRRRLFIVLAALGLAAVALAVMKWRAAPDQRDTAPDPFGAAVAEEREAGAFGQRPIATPGA